MAPEPMSPRAIVTKPWLDTGSHSRMPCNTPSRSRSSMAKGRQGRYIKIGGKSYTMLEGEGTMLIMAFVLVLVLVIIGTVVYFLVRKRMSEYTYRYGS